MPTIFTYFLISQMLGVMGEEDIGAMGEALESRLNNISQQIVVENILRSPIEEFSNAVMLGTENKTRFDVDVEFLSKKYLELVKSIEGDCSLLAFDKRGDTIKLSDISESHLKALEYFWFKVTKGKVPNFHERWRGDVKELAGIYFKADILEEYSEGFTTIDINNMPAFLYHRLSDDGLNGFIMRVIPRINYTKLLTSILSSFSEISYVLLDPAGKLASHNLELPEGELLELVRNAARTPVFNNYVWQGAFLNEHRLVIGQKLQLGKGNYGLIKILVAVFLLLLAWIGYWILKGKVLDDEDSWLSIKYKLVIVFLSSIYMPILSLYILSYEAVAHYETVLVNNVKKELSELLTSLDSDFVEKEAEILERFRSIYHRVNWEEINKLPLRLSRRAMLDKATIKPNEVVAKDWVNWLDVRDIKLEPIYSIASKEIISNVKEFANILAILCLRRVMPAKLEQNRVSLKGQDLLAADFFENHLMGIGSFVEEPDRLIYQELGNDAVYWYWNYYDTATGPAYVTMNSIGKRNVMDYLEERLKNRQVIEQNYIRLFGYVSSEKMCIPKGIELNDDIYHLFAKSEQSKSIESQILTFEGKEYVASSLLGAKLKNTYLIGLFPRNFVTRKITTLRKNVVFAVALVMLFSIFTGLLLAQNFLVPLEEFEKGLKALQSRDTEYRVKITNKDELGLLGESFNKIIFEIKDMLLASEIQKCLIPSGVVDTENYSVAIYNKMASDVGGDYADLFKLENGDLIIASGDVTGHGISSSLLVAMVKASILRLCDKLVLNDLFSRLGEMLRDFFNRKKLMSMFALRLNQKENTYEVSSAGHPYPIICDASGNIDEIVIDALPLGVSAKRNRYLLKDGTMAVGTILLVFSDGIYEARNDEETFYGKERLKEVLVENRKASVEEIKDAILRDFESFYGDRELEDDVTLVVLKRNN